MKTKHRIVTTTNSRHCLTFGPLRKTPIGTMTLEQLESAVQLLEAEEKIANDRSDEMAIKRLAKDASELKAEIERRNLSAA